MNEYEKYRLQWMLDHDYSLPDLLERLSDIAMNENLDEIQNPRVMLNEAFERLEYEQGFDNEEIWLCKDEWEHDLYSSNEYSLTDAGKTKVKHFIEDCRIKQDSILKAGLDTAKETTLPSVEDILCNVENMVDEDGKYTNAWNITDNYLSDSLELNKDEILPAWLLEKCGLSDYTKNSQAVARPDWMEEDEILIDRDNDYVLLRDPDENVNQVWTASGKFLSTVQLENETVIEAMEEYYYNITKGGFYIPDRIKEGYMEEDYDNLSKEDIEL